MSVINVLLVDDHSVVRQGLRSMLEQEDTIKVVGEAANVEEAFHQLEQLSPDVILLDIKMPGVNGIDAIRILKEIKQDCQIIMLTLYEEYITEAIEAGASGYLLKDVTADEIIRAIQAVQQGRSPLSPLSRESFEGFVNRTSTSQQPHLSDRELTVLQLIATGDTTKEIGTQLFLSDTTVKREVQHIFNKLGVRNRSEAVSEAYKRKLITPSETPSCT